MSVMEQDSTTDNTTFLHRKECSNRVFIGPWDIKAPLPISQEQINALSNELESLVPTRDSVSSVTSILNEPYLDSPTENQNILTTPRSDDTSFRTAPSMHSSNLFNSVQSTPYLDQSEPQDDEIDYQFLQNTPLLNETADNDADSVHTIKPPPKDKLHMNRNVSASSIAQSKKKRKMHRHHKKPLLWKKAVSNEAVQHESPSIPTGKPIRREPILCMYSVSGSTGNEPTRYKAAKEARFDLLTEKWKQVELVLTRSYITTYVSSTMFWPKLKLEHRVHLEGPKKPKLLELFLLSPLDYSFCLRYSSYAGKTPMTITLTFKARSFLKCQEWYMELYELLPIECKKPCPRWCQVYIPLLELSVNLPLTNVKHCHDINMEDVKEAVMTVLQEEEGEDEKMEKLTYMKNLAFCWSTPDRAEWIYWTTSSSNPQKRIDWAICPQSIEQTHRLELRNIQHTPHDIVLDENFTLKEPPPVEGFLGFVTDFFASANTKTKYNYFASFDQFLFYVPPIKVEVPNMRSFREPEEMPRNIRSRPYISALSPYTNASTEEIQEDEVQRRMNLMTNALGVIDLTEVSFVRRSFATHDIDTQHTQDSQTHLYASSTHRNPRVSDKPCLELVMENGLQIKFEAYTSDTCDLWVTYLAQIIVYWKARKEAEKDAHSMLLGDSAIELNQDGCIHDKEVQLSDTRIWSYCFYEQCRDVVKSGILYYKPHRRGTYSQKMFILTANGWILFYDTINRHTKKKSANHQRKGAIDIAGCYFYSGVDSSKQKKGSNQDSGLKKAPRLYRNGLTTYDDTASCVFSVWKPTLRTYFSSKRQRLRVYRHDQRLSPEGTTWTFLATNRREKEEWVCALNTVTEHMIRSENKKAENPN